MKKVLLFALVLAISTGAAVAKQKGGFERPAHGGGNPIERLTDLLGLDADQVIAITAIFEYSKALRDEERDAFKAVVCEIRTDTHTQMFTVLTPEQQALFDEHQQAREDARKAFVDTHPEHKLGGRHGMMDCDD